MSLTIVYITFRQRPRFEWFARSLDREFRQVGIDRAQVQILVIDGRLWKDGDTRRSELLDASEGKICFEHHSPKPNVWQGPHRLTKTEFFCAASVRNTAFALARGSHVIFVDDLSVLLPGWLAAHVRAAEGEYTLCGTTCKNNDILVGGEGNILSFSPFPPGQDSRLPYLHGDLQSCTGSWLFGGTFSVPMSFALEVNGQDEINDTIGGEDYDFGFRLERAGCAVKISRLCGTIEDEAGHHAEAPMIRLDKPWPGPDGPYTSNLLLNRLVRDKDRKLAVGNDFNLRQLRDCVLAGQSFPVPTTPTVHWADGQPLADM